MNVILVTEAAFPDSKTVTCNLQHAYYILYSGRSEN
jgi:hypothetical protein